LCFFPTTEETTELLDALTSRTCRESLHKVYGLRNI
uniref:Fuz_longin_3 domain-containing protein n=1 Tax=Heterorhabditis bacteriophora TaxID=37862 RepID=A0A1I7WJI1_HETBA